jgi:general secretion pathway protein B
MSYILDALKKADQERMQGEVPDLKSNSPATVQPASNRSIFWLLPLIAIVIALVWFKPWQSKEIAPAQPAPVTAVLETKPLPAVSPKLTPPQPAPVQQLVEPAAASIPVETIIEPVSQAISAPEPEVTPQPGSTSVDINLPSIMELPAYIRNTLPMIKISGHIYDEAPASRMVIINDSVRREGRYISDSVMLETITEKGIILNADDTRFFMSTFDSWPR